LDPDTVPYSQINIQKCNTDFAVGNSPAVAGSEKIFGSGVAILVIGVLIFVLLGTVPSVWNKIIKKIVLKTVLKEIEINSGTNGHANRLMSVLVINKQQVCA
jgi:hypothetical protein